MSALLWMTASGWSYVTSAAMPVPPLPTIDDEPVSVAEVVRHLKWPTDTPEVVDVPRWIAAARASIERDTGLALVSQTWDLFVDAPQTLGPGWLALPLAPVTAADVFVVDDAGIETAIAPASYRVTAGRPARLIIDDALTGARLVGGVRVRFLAEMMKDEIPPDLVHAVLLQVADFAMHRGDEVEPLTNRIVTGARTLVDRYILPGP